MGAARSYVRARTASADDPSAGEEDAAGHRRPHTDSPPPTSRRRTDYRPGQSSGSGLRLRGRQEVAEEREAGRRFRSRVLKFFLSRKDDAPNWYHRLHFEASFADEGLLEGNERVMGSMSRRGYRCVYV